MDCQATPTPRHRGNKAITILRIFLWLIPLLILPLGVLLGSLMDSLWPVAAILTLGALFAIGYFDQRLSLQQQRKPPADHKFKLILWGIVFVLLQLMIVFTIVATVVITVVYGMCSKLS